MKKTLLTTIAAFVLLAINPLSAFEIDSSWKIFYDKKDDPTVGKSARDLAKYIRKVSGKKLQIVHTAPTKTDKIIIVRSNKKLDREEWFVQYTPKKGLLVSGGLPNGVLYAAGEFLERALGCRFLAYDVESVPKKKRIILPDNLKYAGKPVFEGRSIYRGLCKGTTEFNVRSRLNGGIFAGPEFGWYDRVVDNLGCHTYFLYSKKFPKDKINVFGSLHTNGKRLQGIRGGGPGQLCLSNKELRDFVWKETVNRIEKERATLKKRKRPFSRIVDVSANDNNHKCVCKGCMALAEKHGGYSGAMLEFTNDIAARLEKRYPDMLIQTFAYEYTEKAPAKNTIKPRKNVLIHLAQLGGEYYSVTKTMRDSLRPLNHPNNKLALQEFKEWARYKTPIRMWDYWVLYDQQCSYPYVMIPSLKYNLSYYARHSVSRIFGESEIVTGRGLFFRNFVDLTHYLGAKLMVNPFVDDKAIVKDFMKHYYGPAAKEMEELLALIDNGMKKEPINMGLAGPGARYFTKEFFDKAEKIFQQAEKKVKGNQALLNRIGQERIPFDAVMFQLQSKLDLKFDRKKVGDRYRVNYRNAVKRYVTDNAWKKHSKKYEAHMADIDKQLPLPKQFANKRVYDFPIYTLLMAEGSGGAVDDPEAAGGKAYRLGERKNRKNFHGKPLSFGVYSNGTKTFNGGKTFPRSQMATDEKYHFYYLGKNISLESDSIIWVHWSWLMHIKCLKSVYSAVVPDAKYGIYLSIKLTGPAYVKGSKKENAVYVDRVIVTKE